MVKEPMSPGAKIFLTIGVLLAFITPVRASAVDDLLATDRAFAKMSIEKGYDESYLAFLGKEGQTFTGPSPIHGLADAIKRYHDPKAPKRDPRVKITWVPDTGGVSADGTLGWTEGHSSHDGPDVHTTNHYMTVWVKEGGAWKVRADMGSEPKPKP